MVRYVCLQVLCVNRLMTRDLAGAVSGNLLLIAGRIGTKSTSLGACSA